jgi:hypothetical protein
MYRCSTCAREIRLHYNRVILLHNIIIIIIIIIFIIVTGVCNDGEHRGTLRDIIQDS